MVGSAGASLDPSGTLLNHILLSRIATAASHSPSYQARALDFVGSRLRILPQGQFWSVLGHAPASTVPI
jgi:hypothetical protein